LAVEMSSSRSRRARRWSGLFVGLAVLLPVAFAPATAAAGVQPVHPGVEFLALGDSVAFGYRPPAVTPPAEYFDAANFVGYPEDLNGASLRDHHGMILACGGTDAGGEGGAGAAAGPDLHRGTG
jgi:hypothetical protein